MGVAKAKMLMELFAYFGISTKLLNKGVCLFSSYNFYFVSLFFLNDFLDQMLDALPQAMGLKIFSRIGRASTLGRLSHVCCLLISPLNERKKKRKTKLYLHLFRHNENKLTLIFSSQIWTTSNTRSSWRHKIKTTALCYLLLITIASKSLRGEKIHILRPTYSFITVLKSEWTTQNAKK